MRLWLNASHNETEYLPSPTRPPDGKWHTPEQCSYGLLDACMHGRRDLFFYFFFTPMHARHFDGARPREAPYPPLPVTLFANLSAASDRLGEIPVGSAEGAALAALQPAADAQVDVCLVFPRHPLGCPGVLYARKADDGVWVFARHAPYFKADGGEEAPMRAFSTYSSLSVGSSLHAV